MLTPNLDCWIEKQSEVTANLYGELQPGIRRKERCAVVRLRDEVQHTTVRADSSGTRGHAEEFVATTKILLMANTSAKKLDKLTVEGVTIRILSMFPRRDVQGRLDHYEVSGEVWV